MKITYWSDYACPYCYIGETYLKQAIAQLSTDEPIEVEMKAFELDPSASKNYTGMTVDRFAWKYGLPKPQAAQRIEGISQIGREAGLDFHYAETRYTNTFDAHRLTKLAQSKGDADITDRIQERLYRAYFTDSLELADQDVLLRIAVEEGLDEQEVKALLESDQFADEVRLEEREAQRMGVHGVPYFVIGGKYDIPGALSPDSMKDVLKRVLAEQKKTVAPEGMHCGPEGCVIGDHR